MKSSQLITIFLTFATIGLSLPARADQAVINDSAQTSTINGSNNSINQRNNTSIRGDNRGTSGTSIRTRQNADVAGDNNKVTQSTKNEIDRRQQQLRLK
jgi:hypothetical protein